MVHEEHNHHSGSVGPSQNSHCLRDGDTSSQNNCEMLDRTTSETESTLSSSTSDFKAKQEITLEEKRLDEQPTRADQPSIPQLSRALSYGAAAPYAAPAGFPCGDGVVPPLTRSLTTYSEKTVHQVESQLATASRVSTDAQGYTYPEGGLQAWLCVFGSFCGMMSALGIMNILGIIQTYLTQNQLRGMNDSTIGWIFSLYTFLAFFCGIQIGPTFDAFGPRWLIASGSVLILLMWFLIGVCSQYWHFIFVFSICGGVGTSLIFTPAVTAIGHWFLRKRGVYTGLAAAGGSLGGVIWPFVLQSLIPKIGFAWATRVIGFISIILMIFANLFIRSRLPARKVTREAIMPDLKIFRDPIYSLTTAAIFFVEWALFIPLAYLPLYSISKGIDSALAYQIIAIFNVGSCFGRWLPGFIADKVGRFNTMIITITLCTITTFVIWLPAGGSAAAIIVYAVIFGFASGSGISLTPVCVSQLCKVENYGRYYATCYTMVSFACLTGVPIAGALISATGGGFWGVIIFTGLSYVAAVVCFVTARVLGVGWGLKKIF